MAKLRVESVPPPGPTPPELDEVDEVLEVLVLVEVLLLELLVPPEHETPQTEVTSLTHIESHWLLQQ